MSVALPSEILAIPAVKVIISIAVTVGLCIGIGREVVQSATNKATDDLGYKCGNLLTGMAMVVEKQNYELINCRSMNGGCE